MKTKLLFLILLSASSMAQAAGMPMCLEGKEGFGPDNTPCIVAADEASENVIDMLLANRKGYHSTLERKYVNGLMRSGNNNVRVTNLGHANETTGAHLLVTKVRYELLLADCQGTDACGSSYVWTVTETTKSDGFNYTVEYVNDLVGAYDLPAQK